MVDPISDGDQSNVRSEGRQGINEVAIALLTRRLWPIGASRLTPQMLRHACGYKLANDGHGMRAIQTYLGHRDIQNTTRYIAWAPQRFPQFIRG
jgi:integrase